MATSAASIRSTIASFAHPQGGWGYSSTQLPHLEPTCLVLLALAAERERYAGVINAGLSFIDANRFPDHSYRLQRGRPQALWTTSLVLFTKLTLGTPAEVMQGTIDRLLEVQGRLLKDDPEVADMMDIDYRKIGWPWGLNTFSWVEPTAWACLALRRAGRGAEPRVLEGIRLLVDRAFDQGGINYGNRLILGRMTEPIPTPTALMLLALQGHEDLPRVRAAREYLAQATMERSDLEHLSWATLAFAAQNVTLESHATLLQSYDTAVAEGRPLSVVRHALTALALSVPDYQPFKLEESNRKTYPIEQGSGTVVEKPPEAEPGKGLIGWLKLRARNFMLRGVDATRQPPECGNIHIARIDDYESDILAVLKRQYEHYRSHLPFAGKRIVLKPNLVEWHRDKVINTDPRFVSAVIELCKSEGAAEVIVAEGPGHWRNVEFLVEQSGLGEVLRQHGVRFVDLNHDEPVKMLNLGRLTGLEYLYLTQTIVSADVFISLPKLKTHHWAGATLSLKNLFGTLPGICYGWPKNELHWRGIPNSIIDIALTHTPHMAIVDGIIGMEGDGPLNGKARHVGAIIMGLDLVAVDATCCRLMKLPAERIPTLFLGAAKKLGRLAEKDIPQIGEPIEKLAQAFEWPPKIEKLLLPVEQKAG